MIRVLVVDDDALVRRSLRMILEASDDISVVAEAVDGVEAVRAAATHKPDVVLMDVRMPNMNGLVAAEKIAPSSKVIMLTTFDLDEYVHTALRVGAMGFLLKDTPPRDLAQAVRTVAEGNAMLAPTVTKRLISSYADQRPSRSTEARRQLTLLTGREEEVVREVARGLSNADIARRLKMREATVKAHVSRSLAKLGVENRVQAAILVFEAGAESEAGEAE